MPFTKPFPESFDVALVDGDMICFSIAAAVEYGKEPCDVNFQDISDSIDAKLKNLQRRLGAREMRVFLSDANNYRYIVDESYKANRADVWRPFHLKNAQAHVMGHWDAEKHVGLEADDLMAIHSKDDGSTVIVTLDKDLRQVPGWHYEWETKHHGERWEFVSKAGSLEIELTPVPGKSPKKAVKGRGLMFLLHQMLIGDTTDGVLGCGKRIPKLVKSGKGAGTYKERREGIGPLESYALLHDKTPAEGFQVVVQEYKSCFGDEWESKLLQQGRLVHMVREVSEDGKVATLWHFKKSQRESAQFDLSSSVFLHG